MRTVLPALLATSAFIAFAGESRASECETTAYAGLYSGYVYQEAGVDLSTQPTAQGGVTRSCGNWSYDLWNSTELSGDESFGNNGGDEVDFTIAYAGQIGLVEVELSAAYWAFPQFSKTEDDAIGLIADVSRPFEIENLTFQPFLRLTHMIGLGELEDETYLAPGVRTSFAAGKRWTIIGEVARSYDLKYDGAVCYGNITAARALGNGWELLLIVQPTQNAETVYGFGFAKTW